MKQALEKLTKAIETGKQPVFIEEDFIKLLTLIKGEFIFEEEMKKEFVNGLIGISTKKNKIVFDKFIIHLIKKLKGDSTWDNFSKEIEIEVGYKRDASGWSRYSTNPKTIKTGAEIIFYLLLFSNKNLRGKSKTKRLPVILFGLISIVCVSIFVFIQSKDKEIWRDDFGDTNLLALKNNGWDIIDFDSTFWNQKRKGKLTLYTQYGDYLPNPRDMTMHNFLIKELGCKCCEVTVKIQDFNPYTAYEQAGFYLLNKEKSKNSFIRFTIGTMNQDTSFNIHKGKSSQVFLVREFQVFQNEDGILSHTTKDGNQQHYIPPNRPRPLENVWLRMKFEGNIFESFQHLNSEESQFKPFASNEFNFSPFYIGICSFGASQKAKPFPDSVDDIPAYFDYVKVKSCD